MYVGWCLRRLQLRGALIGALDKCSHQLNNFEQVGKTTNTMTTVTAEPDEVKDTDKVRLMRHLYSIYHSKLRPPRLHRLIFSALVLSLIHI